MFYIQLTFIPLGNTNVGLKFVCIRVEGRFAGWGGGIICASLSKWKI